MSTTSRFLTRFALALSLSLPVLAPSAARADFAGDMKEPLRLLQAKQFDKATSALEKIAPQHQDQFAMHYMLGLARLGRVNDKVKAADMIKYLQESRESLLRALQLAGSDEEKKETRDLLNTAESGLKELGVAFDPAPEAKTEEPTVPAEDAKDQEIEALKRRLAELEKKPAAKPNAPKPQTAVAVGPPDIPGTLPKLAPLKPTPKTAKGRVLNRMGKPLANVEVMVSGTTLAGERTSFYPKTNAEGIFSTPVPDGIYTTRANIKTDYNGQTFNFSLYPLDGEHDTPQDSRKGVVEDYVWRLSGLKPGASEAEDKPWNYYGPQIQGGVADLGSYSVINDTTAARELAEFPDGFRIDITFTPSGPMLDGGPGRAWVFSKNYKPVSPQSPYGNVSFDIHDVPAGRYTVRARLTKPDGDARELLVTTRKYRPLQTPAPTQTLDFEPDASSIRPGHVALYAFPIPAE